MTDTFLVYDDGDLKHLPGATPGTPYTACGVDAGLMTRKDHPFTHAGIWCSACMRTIVSKEKITWPYD